MSEEGNTSPLRVLHLQIDLREGGGQRLVLDLAQRMRSHGIHSSTAYLLADHTMVRQYERAAVPVRFLDHRANRLVLTVTRVARLIRDGEFDVLHTHSELDKWIGYIAARATGTPLVTHIHGSTPWLRDNGAITGWPPTPRNLKRALVLRLSYGPQVARAIAVTPAVKREYEAVARCPVQVVCNGVDLSRFAQQSISEMRSPTRSELGVGHRRVVLFVGRLELGKRADVLVEATAAVVRTYPDIMLLIVGDGRMRQSLEERVAQLDLSHHVRFLGRLEDVTPVLAAADLLVLPSRSEGFGLALVEAMVAGVPVIASRLPATEEIVRDRVTGRLVRPEDPAALAFAMQCAFDDPAATSRMADEAKRDSGRRFDIENTARQVASIYRRVADVPGRGQS